jgi:hypothetical protein
MTAPESRVRVSKGRYGEHSGALTSGACPKSLCAVLASFGQRLSPFSGNLLPSNVNSDMLSVSSVI